MLSFKKYIKENIGNTKRKGIPHFETMKPLDFLRFADFLKKETNGKIKSGDFHVTEKVDGFPFRFGIDSTNKFFIESGFSGVIYSDTYFEDRYTRLKLFDRLDAMKALDTFHVYLKTHKKLIDILSKYNNNGIKVVCEMLLNPMGKDIGDKIKFIKLAYDKNKIGKYATVVVLDILDSDNKEYINFDEIVNELVRASDEDFRIVNLKSKDDIDIDLYVDMDSLIKDAGLESGDFTEIENLLKSRKSADKAEKEILLNIITSYQEEMSIKIRKVIDDVDGDFGSDMEGLVFKIKNHAFKLTTNKFKNATLVWRE